MKIVTGMVVDGKIEACGIEEGSSVAILAPERGESFRLSPSEEEELSTALEDIQAGRFADGRALLEDLKAQSAG